MPFWCGYASVYDRPVTTQPSFFIPHGAGPCFFIDGFAGPPGTWDGMAAFLRDLRAHFPEPPRALLVVTAHWETEVVTVTSGRAPGLLHDWFEDGLPPQLASLEWPAPGAPEVADEILATLRAAGIDGVADPARGFDHGVFCPMKLAVPEAEIPTVALSILADLDPARHLAIGAALAPLRERGVVIIGSGSSFHDLRPGEDAPEASRRFDAWLGETVALEAAARRARLVGWADAPSARACHPREEHLLPLMVAAGAAGTDPGRTIYSERLSIGVRMSAHAFG